LDEEGGTDIQMYKMSKGQDGRWQMVKMGRREDGRNGDERRGRK
jgi:hypothetical protein